MKAGMAAHALSATARFPFARSKRSRSASLPPSPRASREEAPERHHRPKRNPHMRTIAYARSEAQPPPMRATSHRGVAVSFATPVSPVVCHRVLLPLPSSLTLANATRCRLCGRLCRYVGELGYELFVDSAQAVHAYEHLQVK